jgi:hypothetical protein
MGQTPSKSQIIIELAFEQGYWIYGGYLRDTMIGDRFRDLDFGCSFNQVQSIPNFISKLSERWKTEVVFDSLTYSGSVYSSTIPYLRRIIKIDVEGLEVDIGVYTSMGDWMKGTTAANFTCNLFYKTKDIPLGLKYVPEGMSPEEIYSMTQQRKCKIIQGRDDELKKRTESLTQRGWLVL